MAESRRSHLPLDELLNRYDRLEGVFRLTRAVAQEQTEAGICKVAIEMLTEAMPGRRASILLFDPDGVMRFKAWHQLSDRYRDAVTGHTPWKPDDIDATPFVVPDPFADRHLADLHQIFRDEQIGSLCFVPLISGPRLIGKFMVYGSEAGDPVGENLPLVRNIADLVAIAVQRARADERLRREQELFGNGPVVVLRREIRPGFPLRYVSPAIAQFGHDAAKLLEAGTSSTSLVHPDDQAGYQAEIANRVAAGADSFEIDYRLMKPCGEWAWIYDRTVVVYDEQRHATFLDSYLLDITLRKNLEQELLQAQKMESIGRLAGGVAHDFNNLLTVIIGAAEVAALRSSPDPEIEQSLQSIRKAADRAAALTAQLLAFARKQRIARRLIDVDVILTDIDPMLRRLIGEHIELVTTPAGQPAMIEADPIQLQQILVNLVVNARDAMPQGGRLEIGCSVSDVPDSRVTITIRDTGTGMSQETLAHLFEPFFTTKQVGRGTGLGLATCYGIVQQSGGQIEVESEPGKGTIFQVSFPRASGPIDSESDLDGPRTTATSSKGRLILVAEDESMVRDFVAATLRRAGFELLVAENGHDALALALGTDREIDLVITDIVMPQLGGREFVRELSQQMPDIPVLFTSGYTPPEETVAVLDGSAFLPKPFTATMLLEQTRLLISESQRRRSSR